MIDVRPRIRDIFITTFFQFKGNKQWNRSFRAIRGVHYLVFYIYPTLPHLCHPQHGLYDGMFFEEMLFDRCGLYTLNMRHIYMYLKYF